MDPIYWSFVLLALGFFVILLELFVPSAGVLGVLAACLLIAGVVLAFMQDYRTGSIVFIVTAFSIPVLLAMLIKVWPHTPIGKLILLKDRTAADVLPNGQQYVRRAELVGKLGVAKSQMFPSGQILVDGEKYDALSDGFPIEANEPIKVIAVRGNHVYVERHSGDVEDATNLPVRDRDVLTTPIEELGIDLDKGST